MLSNANAKESKRSQRNSEERAFGIKTERKKVFTRAAAASPAAKNSLQQVEFFKYPYFLKMVQWRNQSGKVSIFCDVNF